MKSSFVAALACCLALPLVGGCAAKHARNFRDVPPDLLSEEDGEPGLEGEVGSEGVEMTRAPEPPEPEAQTPSEGDGQGDIEREGQGDLEDEADKRIAAPATWLSGQQLTSEGHNTHGRWDSSSSQIIFLSVRGGGLVENPNPQTWLMNADGTRQRRITMGIGVTDAPGFVATHKRRVFYGSTHHTGETPAETPPDPADMEVYSQDLDEGLFERLTNNPGFDGEAAWCAWGASVVFTSTRTGNADLFLVPVEGTEATQLTEHPGADRKPAWSPDCKSLAWTRDGALMLAAADARDPVVLVEEGVTDPAWHPDGDHLIFAATAEEGESQELFVIGIDGTGLRRLTSTSGAEQNPSFSPDGSRVLYAWDRTGTPQLFVAQYAAEFGADWNPEAP